MITIKDHYPVIDQTIQQVKDRFGSDSKIAVMFENCISNTLQTTIKVLDDGSIFVITGDIPAMWLRDSACQLRPFLFFAKEDPEIADIIGADSLGYLPTKDLCHLIGDSHFCSACFDGNYPTTVPESTQKDRFERPLSARNKEKN